MWTLVDFFNWVSDVANWFRPPAGTSRRRWLLIYPLIILGPLAVLALVIWAVEG